MICIEIAHCKPRVQMKLTINWFFIEIFLKNIVLFNRKLFLMLNVFQRKKIVYLCFYVYIPVINIHVVTKFF